MSAIYIHSCTDSVCIRMRKHLIKKLSRCLRRERIGIGPLARDALSPHVTKGMRHDKGVVLGHSKILFKYVHTVDGII